MTLPQSIAMTGQGSATPGPWLLAEGNISAMVYALDQTGSVNRFSTLIQGGYSYSGRTVKERTSDDELSANARLIAAAPELLTALQGAIGALEQDYDAGKDMGDDDWEGIAFQRLETAHAAIAKATGQPALAARSSVGEG